MENEALLQFVWRHHLYVKDKLVTADGESVEVIDHGQWNTDSGPDFFNASIKIADTVWAGNVEIHLKASDWYAHKHDVDKAYNNVILHVVLINDREVKGENGAQISTLVIKPNSDVLERNDELMEALEWPSCKNYLSDLPSIYWHSWFSRLMVERLESKTEIVMDLLRENGNNWEQCFFVFLLRNFGMKVNQLPFEMLGKNTPVNTLYRQKNNLLQVEAILFGQSGMLNEALLGDDYFIALRNEYSHLSKKYRLKGIESFLWKFMRLRPANFPTIRIAQIAAMISQSGYFLNDILNVDGVKSLEKLFNVKASVYWDTHYQFNKDSKFREKRLGQVAVENIIINTVVPFLFVYGEVNEVAGLKDKALNLLEELRSENNSIIRRWSDLGVVPKNAFDSQALLQLKNVYCEKKQCIHCQIGAKLMIQ